MKTIYILFSLILTINTSLISQTSDYSYLNGNIYEIYPSDDIKSYLNDSLQPGDQLVLHEGIYSEHFRIKISGTASQPIVIRGYGNGEERPTLSYIGSSYNLMEVRGSNLVFDYMKFHTTTYAMRLGSPQMGESNILIQNCVFDECNNAISSNYKGVSYDNIRVLNNYFVGPHSVSAYIGAHKGSTSVTRFVFRGNVVDCSQNDNASIGYGIQLKLNVTKSIIENNFFTGMKGPGIYLYGAEGVDSTHSNIARNNIVINSRRAGGISVGGGPSIVKNNVVFSNDFGLFFQNYKGRDLLDYIIFSGNTVLNSTTTPEIDFSGYDVTDINNVVLTDTDNTTTNALVEQVVNVLPAFDNLPALWEAVSSGPLTIEQVNALMRLILENSTPVVNPH